MKYLFLALTIVLTFEAISQSFNEILFSRGESNGCHGVIALDQNIFFFNRVSDYFLGYAKQNTLYKADQNVHLKDSVDLTTYYGFDSFTFYNLCAESDSSFLAVGLGKTDNPYTESLVVTSLDENLNILKTYTTGPMNDSALYANSAIWADSLLIVGGTQYIPLRTPAFFVFNKKGDLIKQQTIDTAAGALINALFYKDSALYLGFRLSYNALILKLSFPDFSLDTIVIRPSSGAPLAHYSLSGFFSFDQTASTFFAYGEYKARYLVLFEYNTDLKILRKDTFATVTNPSLPTTSTVADDGILDPKDDQHIFFATGEGNYVLPSQLKVGLVNNMKLWRIDSDGNVIWSVLVNDSSYYYPTRTLATNDGGVIFFSMKYDWREDAAPVTDLSIIKLDSNGNFVGLNNIELPYQEPIPISVYPNPFVDEITLSGVELRELAAILVYTVDGVLVKETVNPQSLIVPMENVAAGTYVVHAVYLDGRQGKGKLLKVN